MATIERRDVAELKGLYTLAKGGAYIPTIDLSEYFNPTSEEGKLKVVAQVRAACLEHGFFQIEGHGVPLETQKNLFKCAKTFFDLPQEEKTALSLRNFSWRRGYDGFGYQQPHDDVLPDAKEGFFIGQDLPMSQVGFLKGPNVWPASLKDEQFKDPAMEYFNSIEPLGRKLWEVICVSLGYPADTVDKFIYGSNAMFLKLLKYPEHTFSDPRQFGSGQHTDYGGLTILLQSPGQDGLEVWHEKTQTWIEVPAVENRFVINLGDIVQKWTGGEYKSNIHRVINKTGGERYTAPIFVDGNLEAVNPLNGGSSETVSQHIYKKFYKDYFLADKSNSEEIKG